MTSSQRAGTTENTRDLWECRYFVTNIPRVFTHDQLSSRFPGVSGPFRDDDIYIISDDAAINIKLRRRPSTIKIKVRLECLDDGFEHWRTELDSSLPASIETWNEILALLHIRADIKTFLACSDPDCVIGALRGATKKLVYVEALKQRSFYWASSEAKIEVAQVTIGALTLGSVVFESKVLAQARALRDQFVGEFDKPENYVSLISRVADASIGNL